MSQPIICTTYIFLLVCTLTARKVLTCWSQLQLETVASCLPLWLHAEVLKLLAIGNDLRFYPW